MAAIQDYLGKIKRRVTVLKECLETIPEDLDAARELVKFGLSGTDLESLIALGEKETAEFTPADARLYDDWEDDFVDEVDRAAKKLERERAERLRLISKVNWQSLSLAQKDLIGSRLKLLYYLDILDTYEIILGGHHFAPDRYNPQVYKKMRALSPIENCVYAARNSDPVTVAAFLSGVHSSVTLPHWLPILTTFPETAKPTDIQVILYRY